MAEQEQGVGIGKFACIDCTSTDGMEVYEKPDGTYDATCFAGCAPEGYKSHNQLAASYMKDELGIEKKSWKRGSKGTNKRSASLEDKPKPRSKKAKTKTKPITPSQVEEIKENTSFMGGGFRGISDKWLKYYRVRTAYDEETGEVSDRYYPTIQGKCENGNPKLVGYHKRIVLPEKDFRAIGLNSKECELFGQFRCKGSGKLVLTGGQEDVMAAKEMFEDYKESSRGNPKPVDFVSGTVGETSLSAQIQFNYDFIDRYDEILIDMDDDEAGQKAVEALLKVLPFKKVKLMSYGAKDANAALDDGLEDEYIRAIYNAKKPKLTGIVRGSEMLQAMRDAVIKPLIPLPPALKPLEDKLYGGLPVAEIINILAASGVGKTTITNLLELYWIFHAPYKVGVLSLEAGAGKFLVRLASSYLKKNISHLLTPEAKLQFIEDHAEELEHLFMDEEGEERFCLIDDNGEVDNLKEAKQTIEKAIRQGGCEIIIIDPIQDLLDSLTTEEQAEFVGWQKKIKARDGVTFINVNHTRKSGGGKKAGSQGGELTEEDMQGTSALYKSGAVNIIISRDKTAECEDERHTTKVNLAKSRDAGETGPAGQLYFQIETATLHNKEEWIKNTTEEF